MNQPFTINHVCIVKGMDFNHKWRVELPCGYTSRWLRSEPDYEKAQLIANRLDMSNGVYDIDTPPDRFNHESVDCTCGCGGLFNARVDCYEVKLCG
jgi:hypothetical protein